MTSPSRSQAVFQCEDCGHRFKRRADWVPRSADGKTRCNQCSYADRGRRAQGRVLPSLRRGKELTCKICGAKFYKPPSALSAKTCSPACARTWRIENVEPGWLKHQADNRGKRNGAYKDGKRIGEHAKYSPKSKVRAEVIDRDGDWCLFCGAPGPGLHLHRVVYGSQGGKYETSNCVQLCREHHALVHTSKRTWAPKLTAYLADPKKTVWI